MRCLFRLDPQFRVRRRHLRADSRSGRLGRHALIGSSLAGLLCANEEEVNLASQSAIVIAITKDLEAFVFSWQPPGSQSRIANFGSNTVLNTNRKNCGHVRCSQFSEQGAHGSRSS
jgi:hypothetical protein